MEQLPSEIVWDILDRVTTLPDRKNASLVCSSWNHMLFSSSKVQRNLKLRICGNRSSSEEYNQFKELFQLMIASNRNYVNIEFCYVEFDEPARYFLKFIVDVCRQSLRSLKFESCGGLYRSLLLPTLKIARNLEELHVINIIGYDEVKVDEFSLPSLRTVALYINDNCRFYKDICWMAPKLEELLIRTRNGFKHSVKYTTTIDRFRNQLKKFEFVANSVFSKTVQFMQFQQLVSLKLNVPVFFNPKSLSALPTLTNLELEGNICNEIIIAVCDIAGLKSLTLKKYGEYETTKFSQLTKLSLLDTLHLSGMNKTSWNNVSLPYLTQLHVDSAGFGFPEFLKNSTRLKSMEIHDNFLDNEQLQQICNAVPTLERLELAHCVTITDAGLENIAHLPNLRVLRLWKVPVSSKLFQKWHTVPKLRRLLIYLSNEVDDAILEDIAVKGDHLEQLVLYDCYNTTEDAVEELKRRLPDCEVLRIFRGGPLPASLKHEKQIYCRTVDHPNGILKTELPFLWD